MKKVVYGLSAVSGLVFAAQAAPYYDCAPPPAYIQEQFGPFGPQEKSYPVPEGAVFVSPIGVGSNAGESIEFPTTLSNAIATAKSGDVIVLRGGVYRVGDLEFNKQITIQPYLNERPVLKGSRIADQWVQKGDVWATKWNTLFPHEPPGWYLPDRHGPPCIWNGDAVLVNGKMYRPVGGIDELAPGRFYCDYENGEVYLSENPAGKTVEITAHEYGLHRVHEKTADREGPTILGLDMMQYSSACLAIDGEAWFRTIEPGEMPYAPIKTRIENCRFLFCPKNGLTVTSPQSYLAHNDISYIGNCAVVTHMSHNSVFEHNEIHCSNFYEHRSFPAGIKVFNQGCNYVIRNNFLSDMSCISVWYDVGLREGAVVKNYFRDCGISVKIEISHRHYIAGNVFENARMFLCNSANCVVYNNTFIGSRLDFMRNNRGHSGWNKRFSFDHAATGPRPPNYHGHQIANNVFTGHPPEGMYLKIEDSDDHDPNFQTDLFAQNLFLKEAEWIAEAAFVPKALPITNYVGLAEFGKVYGDYLEGNAEFAVTGEELFRSAADGDYRLRNIPGLPEGKALPDSISKLLGWETGFKGLGAFAAPSAKSTESNACADQAELYTGPEFQKAFNNPEDDPNLPNVLLIGDSISIGSGNGMSKMMPPEPAGVVLQELPPPDPNDRIMAASTTPIPSPEQKVEKSDLITDLIYTGPSSKGTDMVKPVMGQSWFTDINQKAIFIHPLVVNSEQIRLPNKDWDFWAADVIGFTAKKDIWEYIGHNENVPDPGWLKAEYEKVDGAKYDLAKGRYIYQLYRKRVKAGDEVTIGGAVDDKSQVPKHNLYNKFLMYMIFVVDQADAGGR